jgi:NitT/TauT family transport system permease protein
MKKSYKPSKIHSTAINIWDIYLFIIVAATLFCITWATMQMSKPYDIGNPPQIHLEANYLPSYALKSFWRMLIAMGFSLLATFIFGTWAAKSKKVESIIIPLIDILQAIPVLSFLTITVAGFMQLFPGNLLGPEMASIFAVFTAQAWNMILGFYQGIKTVPHELIEVGKMYQLSWWRKFWKIEVPNAMPSLIWNMMMSMSASWFFVVASEAISFSSQTIMLPGVGSYIALAIEKQDYMAIFNAIVCMLIVIIIYDQLFFRPLLFWSKKFNSDSQEEDNQKSWVVNILQRTRALKYSRVLLEKIYDQFAKLSFFTKKISLIKNPLSIPKAMKVKSDWFYYIFLILSLLLSIYFIVNKIEIKEILLVCKLSFYTSIRVFAMIIVSSVIWVPIGVWIGLRPNIASNIQPIIQFLAAFPANLLFPLVVISILHFQLNHEIWTTPLMILGSQWYILFNVIVGTLAIPKEIHFAANNMGIKGKLWWKSFIIPAIMPYYITGAITAAGAAWNASIIAEYVTWGSIKLHATGIGGYIAKYAETGDSTRVVTGTLAMCIYVLFFNRFLWQPLYNYATSRMQQ